VCIENLIRFDSHNVSANGRADKRRGEQLADQYDFAISLLLLGDYSAPAWHAMRSKRLIRRAFVLTEL
jgi:hypothetical protein